VLLVDVLVVGPGGAHAAPVLELGPEGAVAVGECGGPPGQGHDVSLLWGAWSAGPGGQGPGGGCAARGARRGQGAATAGSGPYVRTGGCLQPGGGSRLRRGCSAAGGGQLPAGSAVGAGCPRRRRHSGGRTATTRRRRAARQAGEDRPSSTSRRSPAAVGRTRAGGRAAAQPAHAVQVVGQVPGVPAGRTARDARTGLTGCSCRTDSHDQPITQAPLDTTLVDGSCLCLESTVPNHCFIE
jgi:hypothetical protein